MSDFKEGFLVYFLSPQTSKYHEFTIDHISDKGLLYGQNGLSRYNAVDPRLCSVKVEPVKEHYHDHSITVETVNAPIKSDGGSSSYYDIDIPSWLLDVINTRQKEGRCFIKTEELIETLGSDFDEGNILKCLIRINSLNKGIGKIGNDITYDSNKIIYSANRLKERENRNDK